MARLRGLVAWLGGAGLACVHTVPVAPPGVERVVFVGDSLLNRSDRDHGLLDQVRGALARTHPGVALDLVNAGANRDSIGDIRARLAEDVLALRPAVVVLYWDSDAADVEEAGASPVLSEALRVDYERDLAAVLTTLREATPHVIVCGPTLLGERSHGRNPKDDVLDADNCKACHGARIPAAVNPRGAWPVSEKRRRNAKECDMAWLKDYKEQVAPKAPAAKAGAKPAPKPAPKPETIQLAPKP